MRQTYSYSWQHFTVTRRIRIATAKTPAQIVEISVLGPLLLLLLHMIVLVLGVVVVAAAVAADADSLISWAGNYRWVIRGVFALAVPCLPKCNGA